jgi:ankyrin repeat protein
LVLWASQDGQAEFVQVLLEKGAEANQVDTQTGAFPLLRASQEGHAEFVQVLLEKGAVANQVDTQTGAFPLLWASQDGHAESVQVLLEKGADDDQVDAQTGASPFAHSFARWACRKTLKSIWLNRMEAHLCSLLPRRITGRS